MANHKPACLVVTLLVVIGAVNWGLVGLGGLLGMNLNLVSLIFGFSATLQYVIYLLVGVAGVATAYMALTTKDCACEKMEAAKK